MLVPALLYKDKLEAEFVKRMYDDDFFLFSGYCHDYGIPEISDQNYRRQYAIVDKGELKGYLKYYIDTNTNTIDRFAWYSFKKGDWLIVKEVYNELERLIKEYHRIEWSVICGNPAEDGYDKFCEKHKGNKYILHDYTIDNHGQLRDKAIYEIITDIPAR